MEILPLEFFQALLNIGIALQLLLIPPERIESPAAFFCVELHEFGRACLGWVGQRQVRDGGGRGYWGLW